MSTLTQQEIGDITASPTNLIHILRHFSSVTPGLVETLEGQLYEYYDANLGRYVDSVLTKEEVLAAPTTPGSKFYTGHLVFSSPAAVIEELQRLMKERNDANQLQWEDAGYYWQIELEQEYPEPIGTVGVVTIDSLTPEEKTRVEKVEREKNGAVIHILHGKTPPPTNMLAVGIYKRKDTGRIYVTAYPGFIGGPPLPSAEQTDEQRSVSELYWNKLVFLR